MPGTTAHLALALTIGSAGVSFKTLSNPPNRIKFLQRFYSSDPTLTSTASKWSSSSTEISSDTATLIQHLRLHHSPILIMIPSLPLPELPDHLAYDIREVSRSLRSISNPDVTLLVDGHLSVSDLSDYDALFMASHTLQGSTALSAFRSIVSNLHPDQKLVWQGALRLATDASTPAQPMPGFQITSHGRPPLSARKLRDIAGMPAVLLSASHSLPVMGAFVDAFHAFNLTISSDSPHVTKSFCQEWRHSAVSLLLRIGPHFFWAFWHATSCILLSVPPLSAFSLRALDVCDFQRASKPSISSVPSAVLNLPLFQPAHFHSDMPSDTHTAPVNNPMSFQSAVNLLADRDVEQKRRKLADIQRRSKRVRLQEAPDHYFPMATVEISLPERRELRAQEAGCKHDAQSSRYADSLATGSAVDKSFRSDVLSSATVDTKRRRGAALVNQTLKRNRFLRLQSIKAGRPPSPRNDPPVHRTRPARRSSSDAVKKRFSDPVARAAAHEKHGKAVLLALEQSRKFFEHGVGNHGWEMTASMYCDYGDECGMDEVCEKVENGMCSRVHGIEYAKDRDRRDGKIQSYERHVARSELEFCSFDDLFTRTEQNEEKLQGLFEQIGELAGRRECVEETGDVIAGVEDDIQVGDCPDRLVSEVMQSGLPSLPMVDIDR